MKLLLVGFSDKNVSVFKVFCDRKFEEVDCISVERQFGDHLTLTLPTLYVSHSKADAYIIDLDGVGMAHYSEKNQTALRQFIGTKPAILIKKGDNKDWIQFDSLANEKIIYMISPYSISEATDALTQIESIIKRESKVNIKHDPLKMASSSSHSDRASDMTSKNTDLANTSNTVSKTTVSKSPSSDSMKIYNSVNTNPQAKAINDILNRYFPKIYNTMLTRMVLSMFTYSEPMKLDVGTYPILVNPNENSVLVDGDINRVIDFLSIIGKRTHSSETQFVDITILSSGKYDDLSQLLIADGAKKHSYMTVLWQVAEEVVSLNEPVGHYPLPIKVKFVPNFSVMRFVPSYVPAVVSTCLTKSRTVDELQRLFPNLSLQQLNRTILICILSGVVDTDLLISNSQKPMTQSSHNGSGDEHSASQHKSQSLENKDISTAKRTGFFKRLLKKLAN